MRPASVLLIAAALLCATPVMAQEAETPPPAAAPAAPRQPLPDWLQYRDPGAILAQDSLDRPHMDAAAVKHWASSKVADAMTFRADELQKHMGKTKNLFNEFGWQDFNIYLEQSGLLTTVRQKNYAVSGIIDSDPAIVNQGVLDGAYHWYLQLPLMVSFYPIQRDGSVSTQAAATGRFLAQVQVGRYELNIEDGGMKMESWAVSQR